MFAAARKPAAAAPPGSSVTMLPLLAHFEYALRERGWDDVSPRGLVAKASYFRRPEVIEEIDACIARWRDPGTPRLIGRGVVLRHWQVLAYFLADRNQKQARAVLDELGNHLGGIAAYGYFFPRQTEAFRTIWKWAH
jgi:hypothetical protein